MMHYTSAGVVFSYTLEQICVWTTLHALFLYWGIAFPFSYRHLRISGKLRTAHIICVLLGLIIPLSAALIPLIDGHIVTVHPTLACGVRNTDITFYTFILPLSILLAGTTCLLALMFWTIFRVCIITSA